MDNARPIKVEYFLQIMNHSMRASALHGDSERLISFFFDDREVATKTVPPGDILTDDDCIRDIVENYAKNRVGVYADIFKNHADKVTLVAKTIEVVFDVYGMQILAFVKVEKGRYTVELSTNGGADKFSGSFLAANFSDVLEKVRIFSGTLDGVSVDLADHLNEIADDKVAEWIKWN